MRGGFIEAILFYKQMEEIWKDIKGYEGIYQISNKGRVRSLDRTINTKNGTRNKLGVIRSSYVNDTGYTVVALTVNKKRKVYSIHRLIGIHFIPNPENKITINHKNGIKTDNRIENLEWNTYKENNLHAFANGLMPKPKPKKGEKSPVSKLKDMDIPVIRRLKETMTHEKIAKMYRVNKSTIKAVISRRNWSHIK
jgi:hypothetical protein